MDSLPIENSRTCVIPECTNPHQAKGWCKKHYARWRSHGDPLKTLRNMDQPRVCFVPECDQLQETKGYCAEHYRPRQHGGRGPQKCAMDGCSLVAPHGVLCPKHYQRHRQGRPMAPARERGDGWYKDGYVFKQVGNRGVAVHRLVIEEILGRELLPEENVHHRNGIRDDNRPKNLELWSHSQPKGQRVIDKLAWAHEMLALYGPVEDKLS